MKKIKVKFERFLILCIQTIVRFIYYHPFVICLVFFLLILYKSFPSLLAFLVSSSPVIVCTFLLLGLLLSYGEPNIPVIKQENERTWDASSMNIGSSSRRLYAKENENISIENHVDYGNYNDEKAIADDEEDYHAVGEFEGNKNLNTIMIKIPSGEKVKKASYVVESEVNQLIQGKEHQVRGSHKDDIVLAKKLGGGAETDVNVMPFSIMNEETENFVLEIGGAALSRLFDSSLGLPCQSVEDHHASSDTESEDAESSSPDASMANIIPLLKELHPLLNSERAEHVSITKLDAASEGSLVDHESGNNIIDEKDEAQEEKVGYDATAAVRWTEDDQKNVMDLRSSELERDQRLENLIAKRRARKNLTFRIDRNLIELDANDSFLGKDELSCLHVQVPSRRSPFDIPNDSEETMDLPPIPGSAPSSLLPRQNPFDFLYDDEEQDGNLTDETREHQDFVPASRPQSLFRRIDTFDLGRRGLQQERHYSRFKPYFTSEMDLEGTIFQRQFSDKSESKASFVTGSDTVSPATDQEYKRELERQEVNREVELSSLAEHGTDAGDLQIHTSKEELDDADKGKREHPTNYIEIDEASPSASWSSLDKQSTIDEALQRAGGILDSIEMFSPGALEVTAASGTAHFLPVDANVEELSSVGKKPFEWFPTSVFIDENRSRLSEVDGNDEYNTATIGKSVIQEVPDQDGSLISLELINSSECLDSLIVTEKISEISIQSISDLSKSSCGIRKADVLKTVNSSDEESNEVQSSALDSGKTLLAEIDGSANYHIRELLSNHEGFDLMFQKYNQSEDIASDSKSSLNHDFGSKDRSAMIAGALDNQYSEESSVKFQEVHSEISQDQTVVTQTWSRVDPRDNVEQTVYNPEIRVLASSLVGELSKSSQPPEEGMAFHVSELNIDWPSTATLVLQSSEACTTQENVSQTVTDLEIPVVKTKSIEEINAYFKPISEESEEKSMCKIMTDPELLAVEARPIRDRHSYFKQIRDESNKKSTHQASTNSDFPDVEARSIEEIHSF